MGSVLALIGMSFSGAAHGWWEAIRPLPLPISFGTYGNWSMMELGKKIYPNDVTNPLS